MLTDDLKAHYQAVMEDLESQRQQIQQQLAPLQARLKELQFSINTLAKCINPDLPSQTTSLRPAQYRYSNMSVRWAILDLLMDSQQALTTAEIADSLLVAGVSTRAANFANNVSAVLSTTMKERHNEVQQLPDGKWQLTDRGKDAITHIRSTPKYRHALAWSA